MPDRAPHDPELDRALSQLLDAQVARGRYANATEALQASLQLLGARAPVVDEGLRVLAASLEQQVEERTRERDRVWELSHDLLGVADDQGIWLSVNPSWQRVLGWPVEQIQGRSSYWLVHPVDRDATTERLERLASGATIQGMETRMLTAQGSYRLLSWTIVPADARRYCVARDITEERAREMALHDSMDFARLALSAVRGVGVWTYEVHEDCFYCDAAIADVYGIDPGQAAVGIKRLDFLANVHPDDLAALRSTMAGGLVNSGDLELEYRIRHPDGSVRWVLSRGHTYFDADGRPVRRTGVGVDMTRQRLLEQQLRQSQKMEAVGQLTGGLAHDFNNLLAGISGSLEMLKLRVSQGRVGELERYLDAAYGAARRAAALTHRLLAFSRRQPLDPSPTEVNRLIVGMEELVRRTIGPSIDLRVEVDPQLWITQVDPNQLENALLNLCINARDAMANGGSMVIATANRELDKAAAAALELPAGQYLVLSVTDDGMGMSADVIAHAFDPFFTTKPLGAGTGLGLSMIYGFVRQSGGQVDIQSQVGIGSTLSLYLPRHHGVGLIAAEHGEPPTLARAQAGETVLLIDDEPTVRMLVREVLEDLGYRALEAVDGAGGLEILQSSVHIDLLITDVGLPGGINGRQVADAGRSLRPQLKILFITGYAENAVVGDGNLEPGMHLLTKPFAMDELASRIEQLIAEG
ncbi:PAS domain-containing protein [Pseudomonas sp. HR96]|uniref:hybrid sensor histidine kinase/response regulator n=1 Tax=Pseudomonas sp. HR96 TaxID=1027966 RepID=UPI002A747EDA|nr:PAS domain-containing protein [Pseudomonas sp. HR96]WPO98366.1 PAS domain-containing protein [Pseudomonas sp. HR96]